MIHPAAGASGRMMTLNASQLTLRLLDLGFLRKPEGILIEQASGRNRSVTLREEPDWAFFVKQSADSSVLLRRESAVYRRASTLPFGSHLPRLRHADRRLLILDIVPGATSLAERASTRGGVQPATAARLGGAVAAIHRTESRRFPRVGRPWALDLAAPPAEILREASAANREILRIIHGSRRFCSELYALRAAWRATAFVHGDLRAENVLLGSGDGVWIVDWELSGIGDPAWDVGSVFASFLMSWIVSLPFVPGVAIEELARTARTPLSRIRPAIGGFWSAYADARGLTRRRRETLLLRSVRFAAARLVQHAWELSNDAHHASGEIVCALQASLNILRSPGNAAATLAGSRS